MTLSVTDSVTANGYPPEINGGLPLLPKKITPETPTMFDEFFTTIPNGKELALDVNATPPDPEVVRTNLVINASFVTFWFSIVIPDKLLMTT